MGILRALFAGAVVAFASWGAAQDSPSFDNLKRTAGYEEFSLKITKSNRMTRRFFELGEMPVPSTADKDVTETYVLRVKGNRARTDQMRGTSPGQSHFIGIFDGKKTLKYDVAKTSPQGRPLLRGAEDDHNALEWTFWRALGRDDETLRFWWDSPVRIESVTEGNGVLTLREKSEGQKLIRYNLTTPHSYLGESFTNAAGKASDEIIVTKRFADGFPQEVKLTRMILGKPAIWTTWTVTERVPGPVDDSLFSVTPATGSNISRNDEDWTYLVEADGSRSKYAHITTGRPVGLLDRFGVVVIAGAGVSCTGLLLLAHRRTKRRASSISP